MVRDERAEGVGRSKGEITQGLCRHGGSAGHVWLRSLYCDALRIQSGTCFVCDAGPLGHCSISGLGLETDTSNRLFCNIVAARAVIT